MKETLKKILISMKEHTRKLYGDVLDEIFSGARPEWRYLIFGGRGLGKTVLLMILEDRYKDHLSIDGRLKSAPEQIIRWTEEPYGALLIDDIEKALTSKVSEALFNVRPADPNCLIVATSRKLPTLIQQEILSQDTELNNGNGSLANLFSPLLNSYKEVRLNPWHANWQADTEECIETKLVELLGITENELEPEQKKMVRVWQRTCIRLSGGHPAMLALVLKGLNKFCKEENKTNCENLINKGGEKARKDLDEAVSRFIEGLFVEAGLWVIGRAIEALKEDSGEAYRYLVQLALNESAPPNAWVEKALQHHGLAYKEKDRVELPGELIRQYILRTAPASLTAKPEEKETYVELKNINSDHGTLFFKRGEETGEINLSSNAWKVFRLIYERQGSPISVTELSNEANVGNNKTSIYSAIQRITDALKAKQLSYLLVNQYRLGYSINSKLLEKTKS